MDSRPLEVRSSQPGAVEGRPGSSLQALRVWLWPPVSCTTQTPAAPFPTPLCPVC